MFPLISVIVPAYNCEKYIEECIVALQKQSYPNLEIIVVDDGSTDKTLSICIMLEKKYSNLNIFTKDNGGASSARNYGMQYAKGEYLAFVDADDEVLDTYIEYMYSGICENNADVAMCSCYKMGRDEKFPQDFREGTYRLFSKEEAIEDLLYRRNITGYPVLKLWKKEIIAQELYPEDMVYGEDFMFVYHMLKKCNRVVYGDRILYIYYQNPNSVNTKVNYEQLYHTWEVFTNDMLKDVRKEFPELERAAISKMFIWGIDSYNRVYKLKEAKQLKEKIYKFLLDYRKVVRSDRNCKQINRILALLATVSPKFVCFLCRRFYDVKRIFRFEVRNSV